jgi:hypothetical protein
MPRIAARHRHVEGVMTKKKRNLGLALLLFSTAALVRAGPPAANAQGDWAWRGLMLDPARSFLSLGYLRHTIREMSRAHLNVLHLHLIDDQAWRFEFRAYSKVNRPGEPLYTQDELKALCAYAHAFGVEIVPEFDMPGHCASAIAAYPQLDSEGKPRAVGDAIFCPCHPFTRQFIDALVAEASRVFTSPYIHLGGDEPFAIIRWADCPGGQSEAGRDRLYNQFLCELHDIAAAHGKKLILWNDAIRPGVAPMPPRDTLIEAWTNFDNVVQLASAGYALINASSVPLYLSSLGHGLGSPLEVVEQWNPRIFAQAEGKGPKRTYPLKPLPPGTVVVGGEAAAWATDETMIDERIYPRLLEIAQILRSGSPSPLPSRNGAASFKGPAESLPPGTRLQSRGSYEDFLLSFDEATSEWPQATGAFIRCAADSAPSAPGFPISVHPATLFVVNPKPKFRRGWNHFEVAAHGRIVSCILNGAMIWSLVDPRPRSGPVLFRPAAPGTEFRNVAIRASGGSE